MDGAVDWCWLVDGYGSGIRLRPPHRYAFGRDPESHVEIDDAQVSRRHCELAWLDGAWTASDLSSRNGTWVNGRRIAASTRLADRDELRVGGQRFRLVVAPAGSGCEQAAALALRDAGATADGAPALPPGPSVDADDLRRAQNLQSRLLARLPNLDGYELAALYEPHAAVGGDLYDIGPLADGRQLVVLGDVSGHGVQAALVVAMAVKALRMLRPAHSEPARLLAGLNDAILGDLLPGQFVTCFAAALEPASGGLEVVLAGHHPAWVVDAAGARPVGATGMALGLAPARLMERSLRPVRIDLAPGALLLQVTDGLLEAADASGEEYGEERMLARLTADLAAGCRPQALLDGLAQAVRTHAGALADDLTMIAMRRT